MHAGNVLESADFEVLWFGELVAGVWKGRRVVRGEVHHLTADRKVVFMITDRARRSWIGRLVGPAVGGRLFGTARFCHFSGLGALVGSYLGRKAVLVGLARFRSRAVDEAT